jgi:hypothetical protein
VDGLALVPPEEVRDRRGEKLGVRTAFSAPVAAAGAVTTGWRSTVIAVVELPVSALAAVKVTL